MVGRLEEQSFKRSDIIDRCLALGKLFADHFVKIIYLGRDDVDFKHHCQEMQSWYDEIKRLRFKESSKKISKSQIWDWFFTIGQDSEDVVGPDYVEIYENFYLDLVRGNEKVIDILSKLLS